jgi:hypothetical protein
MAAELTIIELIGIQRGCPIRYTCADGATIEKGTLLQLTDPRTVSAHSAANQPIAGVAAAEKVASDGETTIAVYTNGIFDMTAAAAGATDVGHICAGSGTANMFVAADADDLLQSSTVGMLLEAADNDERVAVRILK